MSEHPPMANAPSRYPTKAEDWLCRVENRLWGEIEKLESRPYDHGTNSALVGVGFAMLEIRDELRRLNDDRSQWYREVLEVLTAAKKPPRCGVVFGEDVFHGVELRCTLERGHAGFHDDSTEDEGSPVGSGQPEAAPGCQVCGNADINDGDECLFSDLTRTEWLTHRQHFFEAALSYRTEYGAGLYADQRMMLDFGPCPEESP